MCWAVLMTIVYTLTVDTNVMCRAWIRGKQWLHSGGQSNTHVYWFLTCKVCDVAEEPLQLWIDGIYVRIQ